jgi:hypothetical protein
MRCCLSGHDKCLLHGARSRAREHAVAETVCMSSYVGSSTPGGGVKGS